MIVRVTVDTRDDLAILELQLDVNPPPGAAAPEHVRGIPGKVGAVGRGLTVGGTVLSAAALVYDLATGDYKMAGADALSTAGGALETYAIAVGGTVAMSAGLVLGGLGIAAGSAISGVRAYQRGDTTGAWLGGAGVLAGGAIVVGVAIGAPALIIGGAIAAAVIGGIHLYRWLRDR